MLTVNITLTEILYKYRIYWLY